MTDVPLDGRIYAVRRLQFCAGHRVLRHESKCKNPHGHNYVAYFHARSRPTAETLDDLGRVIDFGVLKDRIGGWIDKNWDHGFIVYHEDKHMLRSLQALESEDPKTFVLPTNPTAENMADYLLRVVCPEVLLGTFVEVFKVTIWETENCYAQSLL